MSTIRLHLAGNVCFTVLDYDSAEKLWTKLCSTYEKGTAPNKVDLMRKLYELQMKGTDSVASHFNDFDALWSQLQAQKMVVDDELKWDTICLALICYALCLAHGTHFAPLLALVHQVGN